MKKILFSLVLLFSIHSLSHSQKCYNTSPTEKLNKTDGTPSRTHFNINNISTWVYNNGDADIQPDGNSGFEYPKGSGKYAIFESGIVWGGKVNGEIRVGGSTYSQGLLPGRILENGNAQDLSEQSNRIYRVRSDWESGDISAELSDNEGTEEEIRAQYQIDWDEWPAVYGAPFDDKDGNGIYNSEIDIPGVPGAHQTIWYVANDLNIATCKSLYGSDPMGIEFQVTVWGYGNTNSIYDNVVFKKYKIINKSDTDFTDMYVTQWHDIDLGGAGDDFQGVDTLLNLLYGYNGDEYDDIITLDDEYPIYGISPPAVGFQLLQGPIIPSNGETAYVDEQQISGYKNLGITSNYFYLCGGPQPWIDPDLGEYNTGTLEMYNHMQGIHADGTPIEIPEEYGSGITTYTLTGNPITGEGWLDGYLRPPCDIRGITSSGSFNIKSGESQEIVIANIAAIGKDRLNSVELLKDYAYKLQNNYPNLYNDQNLPVVTENYPRLERKNDKSDEVIEISIVSSEQIQNYSDNGYTFQGFNIYQLHSEIDMITSGTNTFSFDIVDNVTQIYGEKYDPFIDGMASSLLINGSNSGIPEYFTIDKDYINNEKLLKGKSYYFGASAYFHNPNSGDNPVYVESDLGRIKVIFKENVGGAEYLDQLETTHSTGNADVDVLLEIYDPDVLTGDTYKITFGEQHYYLDNDGEWKETNYPDSIGKSLSKPSDQSASTLIPMPSIYAPNNTLNIHLMVELNAPDYNFSDGVKLTFPNDIKINSAEYAGNNHRITPIIEGQTVTWGSKDTSSDGGFKGQENLTINIDFADPTFSIDYEIFDDGWSEFYMNEYGDNSYYNLGVGTVHGSGDVTLTGEIGYQFKTERYWDLYNLTQQKYSLEHQTIFGGRDINTGDRAEYGYEPIVDGFKVKLSGSFEAPINFKSAEIKSDAGTVLSTNYSSYDSDIIIANYTVFGGTTSSKAIDNLSIGTNDQSLLQDDYELKFTGKSSSRTINGKTVHEVVEGGQMATVFGMVNKDYLATHPLNPTPGTAEPFLIRIPFEVWNIEDPNNPYQVNLTFRDRERDGSEDPFWTWSLDARMYGVIVNSPYNPNQIIQIDVGPDENNSLATWILVFRKTNYNEGDIVKIYYANPITFDDAITFSSLDIISDGKNDEIADKYSLSNNYPNPFNPSTTISYSIPKEGKVNISVFNILGQKVAEIINRTQKPGKYEIAFNGANLASGVYIYRINAGNFTKSKKMILLK